MTEEPARSHDQPRCDQPLAGSRLLVLDDEPALIALFRETFEGLGAHVLPASSAEAAYDLLGASPDLAVLDVNLGGASGFEFLKELRRTSNIPVIMLTGRTTEEDALRGLELGADDYMRKPFSMRELVARVKRRLRRGIADPTGVPVWSKGPSSSSNQTAS